MSAAIHLRDVPIQCTHKRRPLPPPPVVIDVVGASPLLQLLRPARSLSPALHELVDRCSLTHECVTGRRDEARGRGCVLLDTKKTRLAAIEGSAAAAAEAVADGAEA